MSTTKKRINISLPSDIEIMLKKLSERDNVPQATKAIYLIKLGLEIDEDELWDKLAQKRDTLESKFIDHNDAWA